MIPPGPGNRALQMVRDPMIIDERHAGEEGVIRSDIAEMIDRAAAMAVYAHRAILQAAARQPGEVEFPAAVAERLAEQTYSDVLRYSMEECTCSCHQETDHRF